ncbi:polar amino acid ABC transporter, inner membrane subunit [Arthrobacter crystallopoietes BAB-32]|uniref:Polar amino acid ABC transporter, inner membrane subunit n=1 Tax=Arthrobacter crystallopoietes BAB-32 TaxID=1246476 RepID=N1V5D0_9MICC|nr:amino acid ABC transporter permease [Arthrobacter crystallopoietes]EMY33468.1 polar amino acid ABC transporter, inner membrane subunit [Arthrobacter crystallopoietes BAB-32]
MTTRQSVLFDAPGPKAQRRILITNILGVLIFLGAAAFVLKGLYDQGQLAPELWSPFLTADVWQFTILPGLMNTFKAAAAAIVTSVVFGLLFGMGRLSHNKAINWISSIIVEFFRAVPVLLMMIFFWLLLGRMQIVEPADTPFYGVVIALTLYNGSVIAELVRSGVHGLPKGQREAGMAIGMTRGQSLRNIELPQALVAMLPSLISQFVVILKDSALGSIISYSELLRAMQIYGSAGPILQALTVAAVLFIIINFTLSWVANWLSRFLGSRTAGKTKPISAPPVAAKV